MVSGTSASLCWILLSVCSTVSASEDSQQKTAKPGENVTLPCQTHRNFTILFVKWTRTDANKIVYLQRDGHTVVDKQDASFKNRVKLQDSEMKDGNASLILMNVRNNDTGTYECRCGASEIKRRKRDSQNGPISMIKLTVTGGGAGAKDGGDNHGREISLGAVAVLFVVVVVCVFAFKRKGFIKVKSDEQPAS